MKRTPGRNKKGLSSIFMTIYVALMIIVLSACLLYSQQISKAAVIDRLKLEQEKDQEGIKLQMNSIKLSGDYIDTITVNNTGSITVRIKGVYIDSSIVLDPSTTQTQDSYINPQKSLSIQIFGHANMSYSIYKFSPITITTERGTVFTELIANLFPGTAGGSKVDTVYGPIRLLFEEFYWTAFIDNFNQSYLRNASWTEGWHVSPNINVIWRVRVQNVDDRTIYLGNHTCLVLVSNEVGSKFTFYMDTKCTDTIIRSKEFAPIYFVWQEPDPSSRAASKATKTPQSTGPTASRTCLTFLIFDGIIKDIPLGETIPFEAVLIS